MKRILSILLVLFLIAPTAFADDGVFVPSYGSFMESFTDKVRKIDRGLRGAIMEDCYVNGEWVGSEVFCYTVDPRLDIRECNGFLDSIYISIDKNDLATGEAMFKKLIIAAATSLITTADKDFEKNLFDSLQYDYVMDSPAGSIVMYWNCGVHFFQLTKISNRITLSISLGVYDYED